MMKPLVVICGPTATGKTTTAIKLAQQFNGEIISADSRQIYTELDIGSGRGAINKSNVVIEGSIWLEEGIPIHLYNILKPSEQITVIKYRDMAIQIINQVWARNKLPLLVGGTGFYISAVLEDKMIEQIPPNPNLREGLELLSLEKLGQILKNIDIKSYKTIDQKNKRRLVRAIERAEYKKKVGIPTAPEGLNTKPLMIGLSSDKETLDKLIDERTDYMLEEGLLDEVRLLLLKYGPEAPALDAIGYRQFIPHILGEQALEEAVENKNIAEHQYAKRQMTWFKRDTRIKWFDIADQEDNPKEFGQKIKVLVESYLGEFKKPWTNK